MLPAGTPTSSSAVVDESGKVIASTPSPSDCASGGPSGAEAAPVAAGAEGVGVAEGEAEGQAEAEGEGDAPVEPERALSWPASPATVCRRLARYFSTASLAVLLSPVWNAPLLALDEAGVGAVDGRPG